MARQLPTFPGPKRSPHRRYPWEDWQNGNVWEIEQGVDFTTSAEIMRNYLHKRAADQGVSVRVTKRRPTAKEIRREHRMSSGDERRVLAARLARAAEGEVVTLVFQFQDAAV